MCFHRHPLRLIAQTNPSWFEILYQYGVLHWNFCKSDGANPRSTWPVRTRSSWSRFWSY